MLAVIDLRQRRAILDVVDHILDFLPPKQKALAEQRLYSDSAELSHDELVELALQIGKETWPARQALKQFVNSVGQELVWDGIVQHVSRPVAFLLRQRRKPDEWLTDVLSSEDAHHAFTHSNRQEIALVQQEIEKRLFQEHRDVLEPVIVEFTSELEGILTFLKRQREEVLALAAHEQSLASAALQDLEARIVLAGEWLPIEILRDELAMPVESRSSSIA